MTEISMRQLRYFDALAQTAHFGRAADACFVSQPALSVQIRELEDLIGAPLVERGRRKVHLTALGEQFAQRARAILNAVNALQDLGRTTDSLLTGRFRIGVIPTVAPYFLPDIIKVLMQRYPALDVRPREAITQKLVTDLLEARLDAAIVALPISEPALEEIRLFDEEFVLVRPSVDAGKRVPALHKLQEMRLLLLEEGHCFREQALSVCNIAASPARELMEGSSLSTLVRMVAAGIGVTLVPEMAVHAESSSSNVSMFRLSKPRPSRTIGMVWRKTNPLAAQLSRVADLVRETGMAKQAELPGFLANASQGSGLGV